jgi:hypothetical protein
MRVWIVLRRIIVAGAELLLLHILLRHELPRDLKRVAEIENFSAGAGLRVLSQ